MKLKYFAESAYTDLYDSIKEHEALYSSPSNAWIKDYFGDRVFCKESRIECTLPTLSADNDEYTNVIAIYEAFKDKLTRDGQRKECLLIQLNRGSFARS